MVLESSLHSPFRCWRFRIFDFQPRLRWYFQPRRSDLRRWSHRHGPFATVDPNEDRRRILPGSPGWAGLIQQRDTKKFDIDSLSGAFHQDIPPVPFFTFGLVTVMGHKIICGVVFVNLRRDFPRRRRRVLRRARRSGSARCGGRSARCSGSPAGRRTFMPPLQRVPMLVCLLIELKNVVVSGGRMLAGIRPLPL